jgi:hypothetical protein
MKNTKITRCQTFLDNDKTKFYSINLISTLGRNEIVDYNNFNLIDLSNNISLNNNLHNSKTRNLNKKSLAYTIKTIFSDEVDLLKFILETTKTINNIVKSNHFKQLIKWDYVEKLGLPTSDFFRNNLSQVLKFNTKKNKAILNRLPNEARAFFFSQAFDSTAKTIIRNSNPYLEFLYFENIPNDDLILLKDIEIIGNSFKFENNLHNKYANPHYHLDFTLKTNLPIKQMSVVLSFLKRAMRYVTNIINIFHITHTVTNSKFKTPKLIKRTPATELSKIDLINFSYIKRTGKIGDFRGRTDTKHIKLLDTSTLNAYHGEAKETLKDGLVLNANNSLIFKELFNYAKSKYPKDNNSNISYKVNSFLKNLTQKQGLKKIIKTNNFRLTFISKFNPYHNNNKSNKRILAVSIIPIKRKKRASYPKQYLKLVKNLRNHTRKILKELPTEDKLKLFRSKLYITNKLLSLYSNQYYSYSNKSGKINPNLKINSIENISIKDIIDLHLYIEKKKFTSEIKLNLKMFLNTKYLSLNYGFNSLYKTRLTYLREIKRLKTILENENYLLQFFT